ncbi:MAG: pentapeptide repeat-containing protein [Phycisphaerales bacterium]
MANQRLIDMIHSGEYHANKDELRSLMPLDLSDSKWDDRALWKDTLPLQSAILTNTSWTGCSFMDVDFSAADLSRSQFEKCLFHNCVFDKSCIYESTLLDCDFEGCKFNSIDCGVKYIDHARHHLSVASDNSPNSPVRLRSKPSFTIHDCRFSNCTGRSAIISGVYVTNITFFQSDFVDLVAHNSWIVDAKFTGNNSIINSYLQGSNLSGINGRGVCFRGTRFSHSDITHCRFSPLVLEILSRYTISPGTAPQAEEKSVSIGRTDFSGCQINDCDLSYSNFTRADLSGADISDSRIYGANFTDIVATGLRQRSLNISPEDEWPAVSVDNVHIASLMRLVLDNKELGQIIDSLGSKTVLLLSRFSDGFAPELQMMREVLAENDLVPLIFDFDPPARKSNLQTIKIMASIARFAIVNISDPRSVPFEIAAIEDIPKFPTQLIIREGEEPFGMLDGLYQDRPNIYPPIAYRSVDHLRELLNDTIIPYCLAQP